MARRGTRPVSADSPTAAAGSAGSGGPRVDFAPGPDGSRSSSSVGRQVVAAALKPVDAAGALAAGGETSWRSDYLVHFRRLIEAGLTTPQAWEQIARSGLEAMHDAMSFGGGTPVTDLLKSPAAAPLGSFEITGDGEAEAELAVPFDGNWIKGDALRRQLEAWLTAGVMEPSAAAAVEAVMAHPEWLRLEGRTVAVLGAGAEMGPLTSLLRWGATVAAVDLPNPEIWRRVLATARAGAGRLLVPTFPGAGTASAGATGDPAEAAGADLLTDVPAIADWLSGLDGQLVLGNYAYADGGLHVSVSTAVDLLSLRLQADRSDTALAFLATPTDVFAVPSEAVDQSVANYAARSRRSKLLGRPLRTVSRGSLLHRAYLAGSDPGICDALVPVQGPNYALAKRVQRWRATVAAAEGTTVSFHVAPSTKTRSVVKNRALAAAYAGAHHFGVEIFTPETANTLMAALLVHDLNTSPPRFEHPWQAEAHAAVHGGLWRSAYAPRSALGLAALLGYGGSRG